MANQERVEHEQLPFYHTEVPELDRYQRIDTLGEVVGFLPVSKPEQVEVMGLQSFIGLSGGAARHIAEVAKRQHRTDMADPTTTSRKLVRNYVDWMTDAHNSSRALAALADELKEVLNPELRLSRVFEPSQEGLLPFMRYYDLALIKKTKDIETVGYDPQKVKYDPENAGIMHYLEYAMESWRVQQLRKQLPHAQEHESNRFLFWAERTVEVVNHSPKQLKAIANEGLDKVYGRTHVE
jgi:hypothetical protein